MRSWNFKISMSTGLLVILSACFVSILVMAWWPYVPLKINSFVVSENVVHRGDEICFKITGEKFYSVPADILVEFSDGESITLMTYQANNPKGIGFPSRCFIVPSTAKYQPYRIRWTGTYKMNAFNHKTIVALSEWITVVPKEACHAQQGMQGIQGIQGERGKQGPAGYNFWGK